MASSGVPEARATDKDETSSEEPWERLKRQQPQTGKKRLCCPQTPQEQFISGVAAMAHASAKIWLSMPGVAANSMPLAGLAAVMHGMGGPKEQGQQQQQQQQQQPQQPGEEGEAIDKHESAPRGTAGTFKGRRPPKDPAKLKLFLAQKEVHLKEREEARQQRQEQKRNQLRCRSSTKHSCAHFCKKTIPQMHSLRPRSSIVP